MGNIGRFEVLVFLCGAALMVVEVLGTRIIAPFLGASLYSWSSVIAVVLGSLSAGYWYGGKIADRNPNERLFLSVILLCGTSVLFIPFLVPFSMFFGVPLGSKYGPLISSAILFAPTSFLFGIVSPFAIRLKTRQVKSVGGVSGSLYAISTLGSILGTLLAGFFFIPVLGIKTTILATAVAVILPALFFLRARTASIFFSLLLLVSLLAPYSIFENGGLLFQTDSEYYHIMVVDTGELRVLLLDADSQSVIRLGTEDYLYSYVRTFLFSQAFVRTPKSVLLVGMGGGTIGRYFLENTGASVDVLEIDPMVIKAAGQYFGFPNPGSRGTIYAEDARVFLNSPEKEASYDIIFVDVYSSKLSMPPHLSTVEAVRGVRSKLRPGGVVAVNVISSVKGKHSDVFRAIHSTYGQVFPRIYVFTMSPDKPGDVQNIVFFAGDEGLGMDAALIADLQNELFPEGEKPVLYLGAIEPGMILTDDHSPMEHLVATSIGN